MMTYRFREKDFGNIVHNAMYGRTLCSPLLEQNSYLLYPKKYMMMDVSNGLAFDWSPKSLDLGVYNTTYYKHTYFLVIISFQI